MNLLTALRAHLITSGVVRDPIVAGALAPMWLEPRSGTPAPGVGDNGTVRGDNVVGAYLTGGIVPRPYEAFLRRDTVDLQLRTKTAPAAYDLGDAIRAALIDRRNWMMDGLRVVESLEWRPLQRTGSNDQGFDFVTSYIIETFA